MAKNNKLFATKYKIKIFLFPPNILAQRFPVVSMSIVTSLQ